MVQFIKNISLKDVSQDTILIYFCVTINEEF